MENTMTFQPTNFSELGTLNPSKAALWAGRVLSGLSIAFLLMDGVMKLFKPQPVLEGTLRLGWPVEAIVPLGFVLLACTLLYAVPRTAILGAVLLTGYMGGAVASNVRSGQVLFNCAFPILFSMLFWGGLWLRDGRLRALLAPPGEVRR
jgi:hypothetical protein